MADYYVSPTGDDTTGDGSAGNPWKTWTKANAVLVAAGAGADGSTIWFNPGTYAEVGLYLYRYNHTIRSTTGNYQDVIISPIGFQATAGEGDSRSCYYFNTVSTTQKITVIGMTFVLDKSTFADWGTYSDYRRMFTVHYGSSANNECGIFIDCHFICKVSGDTGMGVWGINHSYRGQIQIYKCTFRDWRDSAKTCRAISGGGNTYSTMTIKDCIFYDNKQAIYHGGAGSLVEDYNDFYANDTNSSAALGANSITTDPLWSDEDTAVTSAASPCIDAGIVIAGYVETYQGTAPDMGCYEFPPETFPVKSIMGLDGANVNKVMGIDATSVNKVMGIG